MDKEELAVIVESHGKLLRGEAGGVCANLSNASLRDANLRGAELRSCSGDRNRIKSIFAPDAYPITYTSDTLQIGCQRHKISDWWWFDDRCIAEMDGKEAIQFWREWKDTIRMIIEKSPAAEK